MPEITLKQLQDNGLKQSQSPDAMVAAVERDEQVNRIIQEDKKEFEKWLATKTPATRLDMPHGALRYILIPRRILELAEQPSAVDVLVLEQDRDLLRAFIFERKDKPITDKKALYEYLVYVAGYEVKEKAKAEASDKIYLSIKPKPPQNVDIYHARFSELVNSGSLQLNDYVTNEIGLNIYKDDQLNVADYSDRETLRGKGIATSFYKRLHEVAKELGFRFITGYNRDVNLSFFLEKLGRSTLSKVKPEFKTTFLPAESDRNQNLLTIDFLREGDKELFLKH